MRMSDQSANKENDPDEQTLQALAQSQILAVHAQEMVQHFTDRSGFEPKPGVSARLDRFP
jgi:hypothetical protein